MAGSSRPGPVTPPIESCRVPPRTPGPLGINDQADPNITSLLGDTPGSVGVCDWADPTLPLFSPADPYSEMVCQAPDGFPLAVGFDQPAPAPASSAAPVETIALDKAQEMALLITSGFEGVTGMDYKALADDFDGMGTSFGLIQWNFGKDTLGPLLKKMIDKDATAFKACFGADADYDALKKAIVDKKKADQLKWARAMIKDHRSAWEAAFTKIGSNETFKKIQLEHAVSGTHKDAVKVIKDIREISSALFTNVEFRSYAAIFDLCVQQHGLHEKQTDAQTIPHIKARVAAEKPATQLELMKIVVTERGLLAKDEWVSDCISRRMGLLTGARFKSKEHDVTKNRSNPHFDLIKQFGENYVAGL